jgi:hypothetical protein
MKKILKKYTKKLAIWTVAWVGSLAFLTVAENTLWDSLLITKIGLLINFSIGIGMIIANKNLFDHYDELQKKIHLEALALTLGLTVIVGISYEVSFDFGIINSEPEGEYLVFFISICYIVSTLLNSRRYK